jgi:ABC-type branched-subunit amino acid transport system substrate-binding protein
MLVRRRDVVSRPEHRLERRVGIDAEFGLDNSTSAQAVELGVRTAIAEINAAGGLLLGRRLER